MLEAGLVLVGMPAALLGVLHWLRVAQHIAAEARRKAAHVIMGVLCLPVPWLPVDGLTVTTTAALILLALLIIRFVPQVCGHFGGAMYGVARASVGELCFPPTVVLCYLLAQGNPLLYCLPIAIMTFADPMAALVGTTYRHYVAPWHEGKTFIGSLAFFVVAAGCAALCLTIFPTPGVLAVLPAALLVALCTTLLERAARYGLDNLLVPLGAAGTLLVIL